MKENICLKYQYSIFGDFSDISPEKSEIIIKLITLFSKENFIPASFQELSMNQIPTIMDSRISLSNKDGLSVNIGNKRLDIEFDYLEDGKYYNMDIEEITQKAMEIISLLMNEFKKTCNRIALNTTELLDEVKSKKITDMFYNTKNIFEYYNRNIPFEWNERYVSRVDGEKIGEKINIITSISKAEGKLTTPKKEIKIDGIMLQFDINTLPNNVNYRFSNDEITKFFDDAIKERTLIENEIK